MEALSARAVSGVSCCRVATDMELPSLPSLSLSLASSTWHRNVNSMSSLDLQHKSESRIDFRIYISPHLFCLICFIFLDNYLLSMLVG